MDCICGHAFEDHSDDPYEEEYFCLIDDCPCEEYEENEE